MHTPLTFSFFQLGVFVEDRVLIRSSTAFGALADTGGDAEVLGHPHRIVLQLLHYHHPLRLNETVC